MEFRQPDTEEYLMLGLLIGSIGLELELELELGLGLGIGLGLELDLAVKRHNSSEHQIHRGCTCRAIAWNQSCGICHKKSSCYGKEHRV